MRIGIDITPVIYQGSGIGTYTRELVRNILPLAKSDQFILFASTLRGQSKLSDYLKTLKKHSNFETRLYPFPPLVTEIAWNKLHRISVEKLVGPVDVFHAWDWQQPPSQKAKMVTTIHDLTVLKFPSQHSPKTINVHRRRLYWVTKEADAIIADSNATRNDISKLLKIKKTKIHTVYLAAGGEFSTLSKEDVSKVRKKYSLPQKFVLSMGSDNLRKNLSSIEKICKDLNIEHVTTGSSGIGYVSQNDLPALFAAASVFVYPSLYEGFGLPVVEAMSVGTPVVTSDKGSLKEVAADAAVIINPRKTDSIGAGIKFALKNKDSLIKKGYAQAKKFSWKKTAQKTLGVYRKIHNS